MKSIFALKLCIILTLQFVVIDTTFGVIKWNKRVGEFEPIPGLPTYETNAENNALRSRQEKNHNFNGQPLHLTYFQELGFLHFYENNTKVSGIYGDMWTTLSEMLNFTLVVKRSEVTSVGRVFSNGSCTGILEDARLNRTDIIPKLEAVLERANAVKLTVPFWQNHYRTFAHGMWHRDRDWMFKQFSAQLWFLIFVFIIVLSVGSFAMHKMLTFYKDSMAPTSFLDHAFGTLATICNQGNALDSTSHGVKILTITVGTFSWLILIGYSARLIYSMAYEVFVSPYKDVRALYENTNLQIVVMNDSFAHLDFIYADPDSILDRIRSANRLAVVSNLEELYSKVCLNSKKYVLMDGDDDVRTKATRMCSFLPSNSESQDVPVSSGISKRVEKKKSIDVGILKLREFGITDAIKLRYFPLTGKTTIVRKADNVTIDFDQFLLILAVLAIGLVASVVICVAENIFFALRRRRSDRRMI